MAYKKHRPAKRQEETPFDRILASFLSEEAEALLTPHEQEVKERYVCVSAIADEGYQDWEVVKIHQEKTGVSRATAYRDLREAQELFGNVSKATRQARRYAVLQLAKRGLRIAEQEGDPRAYAAQVRNLILLEGLDKDDTTGLDPEQVQPPTFVLQIQAGTGVYNVDVSKLNGIKDIEYEEIMNVVEAQQVDEQKMLGYLNKLEEEKQ